MNIMSMIKLAQEFLLAQNPLQALSAKSSKLTLISFDLGS